VRIWLALLVDASFAPLAYSLKLELDIHGRTLIGFTAGVLLYVGAIGVFSKDETTNVLGVATRIK
jgi:hypothetical protein